MLNILFILLQYLSIVIGTLIILNALKDFFLFIYIKFIRLEKDFPKIYGENSWAIVTGASNGIGKAFSQELAAKGLNLILIDIDKQGLLFVEKDIKQSNPAISIKILEADLSLIEEKNFSDISLALEGLDVSILVNNAGICHIEKFQDMDDNQIRRIFGVNLLAPVMMTKIVALPKMITRSKRSAIINMSSIAAFFSCLNFSTYGATKIFIDQFFRSLSKELKINPNNNIDILVLRPSLVKTRMINFYEVKNLTISPNECARGCLNEVGYEEESFGFWKHTISSWISLKFIDFSFIHFKNAMRNLLDFLIGKIKNDK